jgi:endonuclease/exonuclease/phosphatase family metal-dependent hydrolase
MLRARSGVVAILLLAACAQPPPSTDGPSRGAAVLRVVTWNVHDLFDAEDRRDPPGELDLVLAPDEVDAKLAAVAAVLARIDADVVVLEEVETLALAEALAARAGYPEARLADGRDPRGIDVAALSRLPVAAYVSHAAEAGPDGLPLWPRDCVELHVRAGDRRVAVVASHLSSALSDDGTRRAQQATRMREIADGLAAGDAGALVLVAGDLNDAPDSPALAPLLGDGAWTDPLPADAWTWSSGTRRDRLDYLLVPRAAAAALLAAGVDLGPDAAAASDHRPVVADLIL